MRLKLAMSERNDASLCRKNRWPWYLFVGLWGSEEMLVEARPEMLEYLNSVRKYLDEISIELWVTDAVSGPIVIHTQLLWYCFFYFTYSIFCWFLPSVLIFCFYFRWSWSPWVNFFVLSGFIWIIYITGSGIKRFRSLLLPVVNNSYFK